VAHGASCARVLDCMLNYRPRMSPERHDFRAGNKIGSNYLFVCYRVVTALMERFCQTAFAPREALAAESRACHMRGQLGRLCLLDALELPRMGRRQLTDALALPPFCLRATLRLKDRFVHA
jgi:hypothetical protein